MIETETDVRTTIAPDGGSLPRWSDEELLAGYRSTHDSGLFTELVRRYERELYSFLYRFLGDASMAEDTFQLTFLQVHLKHDQFLEGRKVRPWLYAIATHQAIDAQRRNRRHQLVSLDRTTRSDSDDLGALLDLVVKDEPSPVARMERYEAKQWVQQAICRLPESFRAVINLIYFQGLKYREAAEILSIPVGTVKSRTHSAIMKLYEAWTESEPVGVE